MPRSSAFWTPKKVAVQGPEMATPVDPQKRPINGLTPIHGRIHCVATPDTGDLSRYDELDRIDIENFLTTLAEVATAIVRREQQEDHESSSIHQGQ